MNIRKTTYSEIEKRRQIFIQFIKKFGDGRITHRAIRWFRQLDENQFQQPGTLIAIATDQNRLAGIILFADYGKQEAFIVVHPQYRQKGIGEKLVSFSLTLLPKIYTKVAYDNIPSLKLCFACGLKAFRLFKGPTGKPTFWLGAGDFHESEVDPAPFSKSLPKT
jgi:GNAT superfamily N-acetyltransferase